MASTAPTTSRRGLLAGLAFAPIAATLTLPACASSRDQWAVALRRYESADAASLHHLETAEKSAYAKWRARLGPGPYSLKAAEAMAREPWYRNAIERAEELSQRAVEAERVLLATPAPDIAAVLRKIELGSPEGDLRESVKVQVVADLRRLSAH